MTKKKLTRGIDEEFAKAFKQSELFTLYKKNKKELFLGVRNNYLNLYYNCDSVAKIDYKKEEIICQTSKNYLHGTNIRNHINISPRDICKNYAIITENIAKRSTPEKKAQSKLVILNNLNKNSKWFCIDVEWAKAFENKQQKDDADFNARFDIIAISKENNHKVALIELKYGRQAIGGYSGIYRHIENFNKYRKKRYFNSHKKEIIDIIKNQKMLGVNVPVELQNLENKWKNPKAKDINYNFYVITLDNNGETPQHSTPKQTMAAYLFKRKRWGCKELSPGPKVEEKFGDVTKKSNKKQLQVTFLFSKQTLKKLNINDVIYGNYDDKEIPQ
ncbi:MAG: hypothetical protein LBI28_03915 [Treponema sp.]|jgi:Holliday junction resolvase-like predicted endonuclease|nr:hypothetical protein [Treponema sp.]